MPDPIATAYVSIKPKLDGFREELRAGLDSEGDITKTVEVKADTGEARVKLDELQARIDELSSRSATVKIGTKGSARNELTDIQSALDSFRNETITPNVDPGRLEAINSELDGLDSRLRNVDRDASSASRSLGDGGGGGGGLMATAVAAAPALAGLGVVGAGAMSALAVAGGAAVIGLGAFKLAIDGTAASTKELKAEFAQVTQQWQHSLEGFTQPVLQNALGLLPSVFHMLTPEVITTAQALQGLETDVAGALGSPYWRQFSTYIAGEGGQAISSFGGLIGGLGHALAGVAEGFAPEISRIETDVSHLAASLDRAGNSAATGGLNNLMSYLAQNGPRAAHLIETLGSDFITLAEDTGRVAPVWLDVANVVATLVGDLERLNPVLAQWVIGVGGAAYGVNRLLGPLGGLSGVFKTLEGAGSDLGHFVAIANNAEKAVGPVGALASGLGNMARASAVAAGGEADAAVGLGALLGPLGVAVGVVGAVAATVVLLGDHLGDMARKAQQAGQSYTQNIVTAAEQSGATLPQVISLLQQQAAQVMANVQAHHASADALFAEGQKWADLKQEISTLQAQQAAQQTTQDALNTATGQAAGYTGNLALQYGQLTQQLNTANQTLSQTESLLNSMLGIELSAAQATTGFYQSVDTLGQSLKTNGNDLNGTSAAALANQQAFEGVGSQIKSVIGTMEQQHATSGQIISKTQEMTGVIEAMGAKYGLTKGDVDAFLHSIGLMPGDVKTALITSGYDTANQKLSAIEQQLNALNGKVVNTYVDVTTTAFGTGSLAGGGMRRHASGLAGGMAAHRALVGEEGPEAQIDRSGRVTMLGKQGPEIADIPAGASILPARQTAALARHADGVGALDVTTKVAAPIVINLSDNRNVIVGDLASMSDVTAALDADRAELVDSIRQLVPA